MDAVFLKLLNMSITAAWLVLAVIVLRFLFKKAPKSIMVLMWVLVGIRLVCPFSFESILSIIPSAEPVPQSVVYNSDATPSGAEILKHIGNNPVSYSLGINDGSLAFNEYSAPNGNTVNPLLIITYIASIVWAAGVLVMLIYAVVSFIRVRKKVSEAALMKDNIWQCDRISTPFILGVIRPQIYLPSGISEQDAEYVIAHERAHLKRRDHIWKPLGFLLLTVYWFNPILWVAYVLFCRDIELACDEKVIRSMGTDVKKPYSTALINCSMPRKMIAACPLAFGEAGVKTRIKSVLNYKKPASLVVAVAVLASVAVAVCFMTNPKKELHQFADEKLDSAVSAAILEENAKSSWLGECPAEGHIIFGVDETDTKAVVYGIEQFSSFGFENGYFIDFGGHRISAVYTFTKSDGEYVLDNIEYAEDGEGNADSIKRMFPKKYEKQALSPKESDYENLWRQCTAYAEKYLEKIGRVATVCSYSDIMHTLFTDVGISTETTNKILDMCLPYNTEIGSYENLENGVRYIYRTSYNSGSGNIIFTKEKYGTDEIAEAITVSGKTGEIISKCAGFYLDAEVLEVKDGKVLVEPTNREMKKNYGKIWVLINENTFTGLYEGLYITIIYDGKITDNAPYEITGANLIAFYADVNYWGKDSQMADGSETSLTTKSAAVE